MLTGETPAKINTRFQDLLPSFHYSFGLVRVALVVQQNRMNIPVPSMKDVGNTQLVLLGHGRDSAENIRDFRPRNYSILRTVVWSETSDRAKSTLATLPQSGPLGFVAGDTDLTCVVTFAQLHDPPGLRIKPGGQAVKFDNQYRASIGWEPKVKCLFNGTNDKVIHHLDRGGHNPGSNDVRNRLRRVMDRLIHRQEGTICLRLTGQT